MGLPFPLLGFMWSRIHSSREGLVMAESCAAPCMRSPSPFLQRRDLSKTSDCTINSKFFQQLEANLSDTGNTFPANTLHLFAYKRTRKTVHCPTQVSAQDINSMMASQAWAFRMARKPLWGMWKFCLLPSKRSRDYVRYVLGSVKWRHIFIKLFADSFSGFYQGFWSCLINFNVSL